MTVVVKYNSYTKVIPRKQIFVYDCILKIYNFRDSEVDGKENIPEEKPKNLDDNLEKVCESETC